MTRDKLNCCLEYSSPNRLSSFDPPLGQEVTVLLVPLCEVPVSTSVMRFLRERALGDSET